MENITVYDKIRIENVSECKSTIFWNAVEYLKQIF